jgi:hypothetical protein
VGRTIAKYVEAISDGRIVVPQEKLGPSMVLILVCGSPIGSQIYWIGHYILWHFKAYAAQQTFVIIKQAYKPYQGTMINIYI